LYAYNFEYDGRLLSDIGFIVCHFNDSGGLDTADGGSEISFETATSHSGKRFFEVGSEYKKCLTTKFQICKDPKIYREDEMEITAEEFRRISRWLNRREFLWFHGFDWCEPEISRPWVRASSTLTRIDLGNATIGIEVDMTTDSPFGYGDEVIKTFEFTSEKLTHTFVDENDEIGETYPELKVTCNAGGTWTLADDITGCSCEVANCVNGEILHFSGDTMVIETESVTHQNTLANDFNYDYFRFGNTYEQRLNTFTATIPCTVELRYRPQLKDTI
jgi:hypothetical protein